MPMESQQQKLADAFNNHARGGQSGDMPGI
jgi:hypothetical protein